MTAADDADGQANFFTFSAKDPTAVGDMRAQMPDGHRVNGVQVQAFPFIFHFLRANLCTQYENPKTNRGDFHGQAR